jgi:general secretion pathway protein E
VRAIFGKPVEIAVATSERRARRDQPRLGEEGGPGGTLQGDHANEEDNVVDIIDSDDDAPIIAWVNGLFAQAVRERASDIHIEPEERDVVVRYRIDGELYIAKRASKQFMAPIVARVKIMASLNIAEKRLPQDGRIT